MFIVRKFFLDKEVASIRLSFASNPPKSDSYMLGQCLAQDLIQMSADPRFSIRIEVTPVELPVVAGKHLIGAGAQMIEG